MAPEDSSDYIPYPVNGEAGDSASNQKRQSQSMGQQLSHMLSGAANAINETIHHPLGGQKKSGSAKKRAAHAAFAGPGPDNSYHRAGFSSENAPDPHAFSDESVEGVNKLFEKAG